MSFYNVSTFGSATIDHYIVLDPSKVFRDGKKHRDIKFHLGSKFLIKEYHLKTGGGGTNSAAAFSRLGFNAFYTGVIGRDMYGDILIQKLDEEKIGLNVKRKGLTSFSIIFDVKDCDRTIFTFKGAGNDLEMDDIKKRILRKSDIIYFSNTLGKTLKTVKKIIRSYRPKIYAFNPSEYMIKIAYDDISFLVNSCDIVVMNKDEAGMLIKRKGIRNLFKGFISRFGDKIYIITDGANGAYGYFQGNIYYIPAKKVKVVDPTGAGDSFSSTFVGSFFLFNSFELALRLAIINSESVIRKMGAKTGLLNLKELKASKDARKIRKVKL